MVGSLAFRLWYFACAWSALNLLFFYLGSKLRTDGVVKSFVPVCLYFAALLLGCLWARYPATTLEWVTIDGIELFVFGITYLTALNVPRARMVDGLAFLSLPAIAATLFLAEVDPEASRSGGLALAVLPSLVPFAWLRLRQRPLLSGLALLTIVVVTITSRSRTPILATALNLVLSAAVFRVTWRGVGVAVIAGLGISSYEPLRRLALGSWVRFTYQDIREEGLLIHAENPDVLRERINHDGFHLMAESQPYGIGYMNYLRWSEDVYGYGSNLHNSYQTWVAEGGTLCTVAVLWMLGRHYWLTVRLGPESKALAIAMSGLLLMAWFHQVHQMPMLFAMLGLGCAFARPSSDSLEALKQSGDGASTAAGV